METYKIVGTIIKFIVFSIPWVFGIVGLHQWLYTKNPKYYFFLMKLFSKRKDTNWSITGMFTIKRDSNFIVELEKVLKSQFGSISKKFNLANKKHYEFGVFNVILQYDLNVSQDEYVQVELLFQNMNVTVENAENRLLELRMLFNELESKVNMVNKQYNINLKYTSMKNPFFGLMIQRLGEEHIDHFECVFPISVLLRKNEVEKNSTNYKFRVFKEYITITERNFDILEKITKHALLLR
jgi:hypothetical protein